MKDYGYDVAWDEFEKKINDFIVEEGEQLSKDLSKNIAEAIQAGARRKVVTRPTPRDGFESELYTVANNINVTEDYDGYTVVVDDDEEGLSMFLEYGTGLAGESDPHEEAGEIGWDYAINRDNYHHGRSGPNSEWVWGFKFKYNGNYLDRHDINPIYRHSSKYVQPSTYVSTVRSYTDKKGRFVSGHEKVINRRGGYYEYHQYSHNWVLSKGLKPVRYMYDTKNEVSWLIRKHMDKPDGYRALRRSLAYYTRTRNDY